MSGSDERSLDKSAVPHCSNDKVFQAISTKINDEDVTAFPAPADILISNKHSLLLPASPSPPPPPPTPPTPPPTPTPNNSLLNRKLC